MELEKAEQSGFSLIELLMAVAIIGLIVAIAMPRVAGARQKANEASAVASLRAIVAAESIYQVTYPAQGYSPTLNNLGSNGSTCETPSPTNACLIDSTVASGLKDGYILDLLADYGTPHQNFTVTATPESSAAGACAFSADQSGNIQVSDGTASGSSRSYGSNSGSCGSN